MECMSNIASAPSASNHGLHATQATIKTALNDISRFAEQASRKGDSYMLASARDFAYSLSRTYIGELEFILNAKYKVLGHYNVAVPNKYRVQFFEVYL